MSLVIAISVGFVSVAAILAFVRLAKGPSLPDRIVALEHMSILAIAITALWVIINGQTELLDLAIVVALIGFLGTVALARYLESREAARHHETEEGGELPISPSRVGPWPVHRNEGGEEE